MTTDYLEIGSAFLTPIIILLLGIWAKGIATNHEKRISLNDRIIQKRVETYETVGESLNDIFVFCVQVGHWKSFTPQDIIKKKRNIDQKMYISRPYWSPVAFGKYIHFINTCFEIYTGVGKDAKIKVNPEEFRTLPNWDDSWLEYFSLKKSDTKVIWNYYGDLMSAFSDQFGFHQDKK